MNEPALLSLAIRPKTDADRERLTRGLQKLLEEDPALRFKDGPLPGEVTIAARDELQLEIVVDRLAREFGVEAGVGRPQVAYKEAFTRPAQGEMKYAQATNGGGEYAHVKLHLYPGGSGSGYVFENRIVGGAIPLEFIRSIDAGIREALSRGVLAGYPVDDVRIELLDGSYHDIDSSDAAFRTAGAMAFQDAARKAGAVLLEPVMQVDVMVPNEYASDVMAHLSSRRGQIQSRDDRGSTAIISAHVPLAAMLGYSCDLRSRTRGYGTFVMRFDRYQPVRRAEDDGALGSFVGAPRRPSPRPRSAHVALPEPDDSESED
jgi:elongation factor G